MSEITYERIKENLLSLNMKNTLEIIDNYLERAIADKINVVDVIDHILVQESRAKKSRAVESQIQMSGFPFFSAWHEHTRDSRIRVCERKLGKRER